jgi:hypothetical protein
MLNWCRAGFFMFIAFLVCLTVIPVKPKLDYQDEIESQGNCKSSDIGHITGLRNNYSCPDTRPQEIGEEG